VIAYDWGELQKCWFMIDLGTIVCQVWFQFSNMGERVNDPEVKTKTKLFVDRLCFAYGEHIDRD
jgi:hypothetical protein